MSKREGGRERPRGMDDSSEATAASSTVTRGPVKEVCHQKCRSSLLLSCARATKASAPSRLAPSLFLSQPQLLAAGAHLPVEAVDAVPHLHAHVAAEVDRRICMHARIHARRCSRHRHEQQVQPTRACARARRSTLRRRDARSFQLLGSARARSRRAQTPRRAGGRVLRVRTRGTASRSLVWSALAAPHLPGGRCAARYA